MTDLSSLWRYDLRKGNSRSPAEGACLMSAANWLVYGKIGDNPRCSCPIIRAYAIALNDYMPDDLRQRLRPFILRVVGNRDSSAEPARLRHIVLETARRIVPLAFEVRWPELAAEAQALPDDVTYRVIKSIMAVLRITADAAADADDAHYYAADAAASAAAAASNASHAYAATAASHASHAAAAAANVSSAAAAASDAASDAASAYAAAANARTAAATATATAYAATATAYDYATHCYAARDYAAAARSAAAADAATDAAAWAQAISILDGALRIGRQAPDYEEDAVIAAVHAFELARAE